MRFDHYLPTDALRPYVRHFAVSEQVCANEYKVLPQSGLVIGFQYKGSLAAQADDVLQPLAASGITGITDRYKIFRNDADTGTVLVYFTDTGFTHFTPLPANELFNLSLSLEDIFERSKVRETEEKLGRAVNDRQRIQIVEAFLLSQLRNKRPDQLVNEAVRLIGQSNGSIRISTLSEKLFISQSPLEKRFRSIVGTSPKKFASIVRFNAILKDLEQGQSLTGIGYDHQFFDQAHFIKMFRQFTGNSPDQFRRQR